MISKQGQAAMGFCPICMWVAERFPARAIAQFPVREVDSLSTCLFAESLARLG